MGNRCSTVEDEDIKQLKLKLIPGDISRDVVLIKNLKKLSDRVDKLEKQKADKIFTGCQQSTYVLKVYFKLIIL